MNTPRFNTTKFARISYPYGKDVFLASRPLSQVEREQREFDKREQASWDTQTKQDKAVMWAGLTILCFLYFLLDIGLYAWLL